MGQFNNRRFSYPQLNCLLYYLYVRRYNKEIIIHSYTLPRGGVLTTDRFSYILVKTFLENYSNFKRLEFEAFRRSVFKRIEFDTFRGPILNASISTPLVGQIYLVETD